MSEQLPSDNAFKLRVKELGEQRERELKIDLYYLSEQDGDTWYDSKDFRQKSASIDQRLQMTREEIDREIRIKAISESFVKTPEKEDGLGPIGESITIFIPEPTQPTVNPELH